MSVDPAGLALGVLTLAGLFNNAVDCFEYIRLGRDFGKSYHTSLVKLSNAKLRLSRWGASVGLDADRASDLDFGGLEQIFSERTVRKATNTLGQVLSLFAEAEGVSRAYATGSSVQADPVQEDRKTMPLVQQMHELSIKRQNKTKLKQKVKWALYQSKEFKTLISEVSDLVKDLEELFPGAETIRQQLAIQGVEILATPETLPLLQDAASSEEVADETLRKAIAKTGGGKKESMVNNFSGTNYGIQAGRQDIAGGTFNFGQNS